MIDLKNKDDCVPVAAPIDVSLENVSVFVAIPVNRDFPWQTTQALIETVGALAAHKIHYRVQFLTKKKKAAAGGGGSGGEGKTGPDEPVYE